MTDSAKPFWEETYKSEASTFSPEPNGTLREFEHIIGRERAVLDVGCGEGQNCLYLARQGWTDVDAFDLSLNGREIRHRICTH